MINKVLIDGKESNRIFKTEEEIVDFAEKIEKDTNIVIWNDYNNFMTNIQIFNKTCDSILHEISYTNLKLAEEKETEDFSEIEFMF